MNGKSTSRGDALVLIISVAAVMVAATLTMATMTGNSNDKKGLAEYYLETPDPFKRAEAAARAGFEAAKYHIECHGRLRAGRLSPRYFVNGATYSVDWDDVNPADSTVLVRSRAIFSWENDKEYQVALESKIKVEFIPSHIQSILDSYYSRDEFVYGGESRGTR